MDDVGRRHSALSNMAIQIVRGRRSESATPDEHNRQVFELVDRLQSGEYPWATGIVVVDGAEIEFDVLAVGEVWAAFGDLNEDVSIEMQGHATPFTAFRLTELVDEPNVDEDLRWSVRAESFLMRHGRSVPNFMIGWPTWLGNRKASGLRGLPHDLAYLRDSVFRRSDNNG